MMSVMADRYSFISVTSSPGVILSAMEEKPLRSENNMVTLRISPPSAGILPEATIVSITSGAR